MTMRMWMTALAVAMLSACGPRTTGAEDVVKTLYAPYIAGPAESVPSFAERDIYTPELKAVLGRANAYGALLNEPIIDHDPIVGGQDWSIKAVDIAAGPLLGDTAQVSARFDNQGQAKDIAFTMRLVDGAWRVDDIGAGAESIRSMVETNLKPAGDIAAMEAPVRAVYARYAAGASPPPLHRWGPLAPALRRKLESAEAIGKRNRAPVLEFDPVVDGRDIDLSPITYEAAASSVVARFNNAGEPKIVVYTLIEENGAWKIYDISAPGSWDLMLMLSDAGVP